MKNIYDLTKKELYDYIENINEKQYRATQLFDWLHNKHIVNFNEISNINKELLQRLSIDFHTYIPTIVEKFESKLDETSKYLIKLYDDNIVETVLMKYKYGYSLCISSQVGCNMGCSFCASTIGGLKRNLSINELLWQVYAIDNDLIDNGKEKISHVVIMGIGEPLNNFDNIIAFIKIITDEAGKNLSARNITVSTCGIIESINKLANYNLPITLALSLHAPDNNIRKKIMPISNKYDIEDVVSAMSNYYKHTKRNITFEYILINDLNDNVDCAHRLSKLLLKYLNVSNFNINLIPVNDIKESRYIRPNKEKINNFVSVLKKYHINNSIRRELGKDISGSCGQLRHKYLKKEI